MITLTRFYQWPCASVGRTSSLRALRIACFAVLFFVRSNSSGFSKDGTLPHLFTAQADVENGGRSAMIHCFLHDRLSVPVHWRQCEAMFRYQRNSEKNEILNINDCIMKFRRWTLLRIFGECPQRIAESSFFFHSSCRQCLRAGKRPTS